MPSASLFAGLRVYLLAIFALAVGACDGAGPLTDPANDPADVAPSGPVSFASTFHGGIPFGLSNQPTTAFGGSLNGALRNIWPEYLLAELADIKARGGKVVLMFAGNDRHYKDLHGHFDLGKWKVRIDRFKGVDFTSYIGDGTIVGHFLIDEPNDPSNWNGETIPPSMLEEMARYSKQRWPSMATIVRTEPAYLSKWSGNYQYLDAAWAQYVERKGDVNVYISRNVSDAQKKGLGLVVGLNVSKGALGLEPLSGSQIKTWGSALLSSAYPCAFISWQYEAKYLQQLEIAQAMATLAEKARNRPINSCRGPNSEPTVTEPEAAPAAPTSGIPLTATGPFRNDDKYYMVLHWSGAAGSTVDLYRNGVLRTWNPVNDGSTRVKASRTPSVFKICERGTSRCSNSVTVTLQ